MGDKDLVLLVQDWEESERGWGVRPDGCSVHKTEEDRKKFMEWYWKGMPEKVPDEYSRPAGEPYWAKVPEELFHLMNTVSNQLGGFGIRVYAHEELSQITRI